MNKLLLTKKPIIPANLRPNVLAWWDARERGQVWYGLEQKLVKGIDFTTTTNVAIGDGATVAVESGRIVATGDGTKATVGIDIHSANSTLIGSVGKIIAVIAVLNVPAECTSVSCGSYNSTTVKVSNSVTAVSGQDYVYKHVVPAQTDIGASSLRPIVRATFPDAATANGKVISLKSIMMIDLSVDIGIGNEPNATEFSAILAADGTAYWEGTKQVLCNPDFKYYWRDISGNGRHMKLNNFAYSGASGWQSPYGLLTDGVDDYGIYTATALLNQNEDITFINVSDVPSISSGTYRLLYGVASLSLSIYVRTVDGVLTCLVFDSSSGSSGTDSYVLTKTKNMIVGVYSQTTKQLTVYVNGVLITTGLALTNGIRQTDFVVQAANEGLTGFSNIKAICTALIYKALSPAEVRQLYEANKHRFGIAA